MSAEPCVYERLWESIAVLRESGQRYGMSERDIERFITQVLETNEPQEEQPAFPLLRATAKCALALCLLLVLALGLSQPQSASEPLSLGLNWSCPLGAARLLDLPIAHKYNLQGFRGWFGDSPLLQSSVNTSISSEARVVMKVQWSSLLCLLLTCDC
ncbi:bombesin receptor-activated protein C6orf89 homolog isoform X2 [Periophthalmus magnuspinnatus]|uniref:bombesin receptor-activated protein C6orf89 homolog isoform X2 n=1 Tax=Periophthalmus magnuspinnatus TaxID=409849 RepID=UPI00145AA2D1|nr:bombesin receptor-activated protein C6orf89 homolog isoform X2 [Periophthalmus magnuspinnatus]